MSIKSRTSFFIQLFQKARVRFRSKEDYRIFQSFQAAEVQKDLSKVFEMNEIKYLLDLGCGNGGYTEYFADCYENVTGVDFKIKPHLQKKSNKYIEANIIDYRGPDAVDMIFCASVIEHIEDPNRLLETIHANLKSGGYLYLSFPPFYSIGGGHKVKPFHYLPESIAISIAKSLGRVRKNASSYTNLFGKWGLYKRSIDQVWTLLNDHNFEIIKCKPRYFSREIEFGSLGSDYRTWHVEFYCRRSN